jgi:hypothetical protein
MGKIFLLATILLLMRKKRASTLEKSPNLSKWFEAARRGCADRFETNLFILIRRGAATFSHPDARSGDDIRVAAAPGPSFC